MSKRIKRFVATNQDGIPFRSQLLMTEEECEHWIERDIKDLRENCGIDAERSWYGIFDLWGEYTIGHGIVTGELEED